MNKDVLFHGILLYLTLNAAEFPGIAPQIEAAQAANGIFQRRKRRGILSYVVESTLPGLSTRHLTFATDLVNLCNLCGGNYELQMKQGNCIFDDEDGIPLVDIK